jgi:tetratricopeptide (TPR) repeat protein
MATSEIDKLERRYTENPHGLTFAPLAEVHRKNGDVARALELLTAGLELHPNYIPASIVLGRCHQDLGDLSSAEAAFAHVLRLDDENVIALKSLADINERQERFGEAETWLRRLVSIDRSNEEAREQLLRIETANQGEKEVAPETVAPAPVLEMIDLTPEPVVESPEPATSRAELLPVDLAAMKPPPPAPEQPSQEATPRAEEVEPAPLRADPVAVLEDEQAQDTAEPERPPGAIAEALAPVEASSPPRAEEQAGQDESVQPLEGLISAEFQPPLQATGGLGVETSDEVVLEVSGDSEFRVPDASEDLRPRPQQPAKRVSYVAADTKGQSVAAFFRALVAARPPSDPGSRAGASAAQAADGAVPPGEREADTAVSFDDFFNSEADGSTPLRHRNSDPGKDDLDQFQSWLQNLKR